MVVVLLAQETAFCQDSFAGGKTTSVYTTVFQEDQTASTENPKRETSRHQSLLSKKEQNELKRLEREIKTHQDEKMELELKFADPSLSQEDIGELSREMESLLSSISDKEERWMELSLKAEG